MNVTGLGAAPGEHEIGREEWRRGWTLPLVSFVAMIVAVAHLYTLGAFMPALEAEFGWTRSQISAGLTVVSVIGVVCAPFMGALIDRLGPRRVGIPGLAVYCIALGTLSLTGPLIWTWWLAWILVAAGSLSTKPTVWTAAITSRFDRARGLAIALALCGNGLGSAIFPYVATVALEQFGWRGAYLAIAAVSALISIPLVWLLFRDAADISGHDRKHSKLDRSGLPGVPFRQAMRSARFIKLAIASPAITMALLALIVHFVPILLERGISARAAAATAGLIGVGSIAGRLITGLLLDRFSGPKVAAIAFLLPVFVCVLIPFASGGPLLWFVALLLGMSLGAEVDVLAYLTSRYFGIRHFGVLFGTLVGLQSFGGGVGPLVAGFIYDHFGSYDPLLWLVIPLFILASALAGTLGPYPAFARHGDPAADEPSS